METQHWLESLIGSSAWVSAAELIAAVRTVAPDGYQFDCLEEWRPGQVIIRRKPVGRSDAGFSYCVELQAVALAA